MKVPAKIPFHKMEGGGNDFIIISAEYYKHIKHRQLISKLCDRHRGIGADGLIAVERLSGSEPDFRMFYHNSDGSADCFCGNGARCAVAFADRLSTLPQISTFEAWDGLHTARIYGEGDVEISIKNTSSPKAFEDGYFIDTGSPHFALRTDEADEIEINSQALKWRHHPEFQPAGVNVDFWTERSEQLYLRTFERGVEAETLACGTGIVAVALVHHFSKKNSSNKVNTPLQMKGGSFQVQARKTTQGYEDISLRGPVRLVFKGEISI